MVPLSVQAVTGQPPGDARISPLVVAFLVLIGTTVASELVHLILSLKRVLLFNLFFNVLINGNTMAPVELGGWWRRRRGGRSM